METYRIENLTFTYPNRQKPALSGVSLKIERGEFVAICGPSGCGKTTLLRCLKPSAAPHGAKSGQVCLGKIPLGELSDRDSAAKIGFVMQSPENQVVTDKVWHELVFGLESLGFSTPEIRLRVAETASFFGIQAWFHKAVSELSGGQKQTLALASVMAMQPSILILDEPTSQLDPIAASEFLALVGKINRELGVTVILTEHRLEEVLPLSTRAVVMDGGRVIADGPPRKVGLALRGQANGIFLAMPTPMQVWAQCGGTGECPVTVGEGVSWLSGQSVSPEKLPADDPPTGLKPAVILDDVWFRYQKNLPDVVKGLSFQARYGEITAILGGNGAGKTTMISLVAGLCLPYRGKVCADAKAYALPQNPQTLFVAKTVREDLLEVLSGQKTSKDQKAHKLADIAKLCRLEGLLDSHPYDLSGGEQQRAALAKVLLLEPKILLLDEPTKGLDAQFKQLLAAILRSLAEQGVAVVMVSHDIEFCAECAQRCALFFDGAIATENTPRAFFSGNRFYTTIANRMARHVLPTAITPVDIMLALGGKATARPEITDAGIKHLPTANQAPLTKPIISPKRVLPKRTLVAVFMVFLTIPLTIWAGLQLFDDRRFYLTSMLIILQTMLPFALVFERRKPQACELVVIAVLCSIAVAGRVAFFMLPQFKPMIALIIIAGVAFGGEAGFMVGSISGFISNMFFGQGPWTPWQMFALGIIGFFAGVLFGRGLLRRAPMPLAVFGGLATVIVYGGIMNPAIVFIFQPSPTPEMFLAAYLSGLPFDLVHAASTVVFLAVISRPMLEKLERIKIKYGLVEVD